MFLCITQNLYPLGYTFFLKSIDKIKYLGLRGFGRLFFLEISKIGNVNHKKSKYAFSRNLFWRFEMADYVKRFCNTFLIEGLFLMVLGLLLLFLPQISTLAFSFIISVSLILGGIYKLISSVIRRDEIEKSWLSVIISLFMVFLGAYLTVSPLFSVLLFTMLIGIYFVLEGVNSIIMAAESKGILKHWWVGLLIGILQFSLAFVILFGLPMTAIYTVGTLIAVSLILSGLALFSVYTGAGCRRLAKM